MVYLLLAIVTSTLIIITFKIFDRSGIQILQAISANYLTASVTGLLFAGLPDSIQLWASSSWLGISGVIGVTLIVAFYLYALSARHAGITVTAVAGRMSVVIPAAFGLLFLGDQMNFFKLAGLVAAILSLLLTTIYPSNQTIGKKHFWLPLMLFLAIGINDTMMKVAEMWFITDDFELFLSTAFGFSWIISMIVLFSGYRREPFHIRHWLAGVVLGLLNWFSTLFFLKGLQYFEVSIFIPAYNVSVVALATVAGFLFFREPLHRSRIVGVLLAAAAIILFALAGV